MSYQRNQNQYEYGYDNQQNHTNNTSYYHHNNNNNTYNNQQNQYHRRYPSNYNDDSRNNRNKDKQIKSSRIVSIKRGNLISTKRTIKEPIFYDPESEIATKCRNIPVFLKDSMFEEEEKERLIRIEQCHLIESYQNNLDKNGNVDSDGHPVTPSGSEQDDDDDIDKNEASPVRWGPTKHMKMRNIWDVTRDHALNDENGNNLLNNDRNHVFEDYGIYNESTIYKQASIIPKYVAMDGQDIIDRAQIVNNNKIKKKHVQNGNGSRKQKKRRRGGKGKRNRNRNNSKLNQEENDCTDCKMVVGHIDKAKKYTQKQLQLIVQNKNNMS